VTDELIDRDVNASAWLSAPAHRRVRACRNRQPERSRWQSQTFDTFRTNQGAEMSKVELRELAFARREDASDRTLA
jgi:hypothetical protein